MRVISYLGLPHRSAIGGVLSAAYAVATRITLTEYLEARLARYCAHRPHGPEPVPLPDLDAAGRVRVSERLRAGDDAFPGDEQLRAAAHRRGFDDQKEGIVAARDRKCGIDEAYVQQAEKTVRELERVQRDLMERVEAATAILDAKITSGEIATGRRRPPAVPRPWATVVTGTGVALAALAESFQMMLAYWDASGVDYGNLRVAWQYTPYGVAGGALLGVVTSYALFAFVDGSIAAARRAARATNRWSRLAWSAAAIGLLALEVGLSVGVGILRHAMQAGAASLHDQAAVADWRIFVAITTLVPLAVALTWNATRDRRLERRARVEARRAWADAERDRSIARDRFEVPLDRLRTDAEDIERRLTSARRDLKRARQRGADHRTKFDDREEALKMRSRESIAAERRFALRFVDRLLSCLAADRVAYISCARRWRPDLLADDRRSSAVATLMALGG